MLKNYMEDLVGYWLPRVLADEAEKYAAVCRCPLCMARMRVEALNRLTPFYVTNKPGEVFGEYRLKESQCKMDLMVALMSAIEAVHDSAHKQPASEGEALGTLLGARRRKPKKEYVY